MSILWLGAAHQGATNCAHISATIAWRHSIAPESPSKSKCEGYAVTCAHGGLLPPEEAPHGHSHRVVGAYASPKKYSG